MDQIWLFVRQVVPLWIYGLSQTFISLVCSRCYSIKVSEPNRFLNFYKAWIAAVSLQWRQQNSSGKTCILNRNLRTSLEVQWLRLHASTAGVTGSILGQGTKIPLAAWYGQKKKKSQPLNDGETLGFRVILLLLIN